MAEKTAKETPDKGAAARAERKPKPKKLKFKGLDLILPVELPPTILFDLTSLESAGENPMPIFRLLQSIVGEGQFVTIRGAMESNAIEPDDLAPLIEAIFKKYGITPGESSASQDS